MRCTLAMSVLTFFAIPFSHLKKKNRESNNVKITADCRNVFRLARNVLCLYVEGDRLEEE